MSTTTATAAKITYRKTAKGEWVAYGPASVISKGARIAITKTGTPVKDSRWVESVGRPFTVDGTEMVYGYLMPDPARPGGRAGKAAGRPAGRCRSCFTRPPARNLDGLCARCYYSSLTD